MESWPTSIQSGPLGPQTICADTAHSLRTTTTGSLAHGIGATVSGGDKGKSLKLQCYTLGGTAEISTTIEDLKNEGVLPFNSLIWPLQKTKNEKDHDA